MLYNCYVNYFTRKYFTLSSYNKKPNQSWGKKEFTLFSTYDLKAFSKRLKEIRKSSGFTQEDVVAGTGLSSETLRKLENGLTIPRYDTVEILSMFYKTDLHAVLNHYKSSKDLLKFYDLVDYHLTDDDKSSLSDTIIAFRAFLDTNESNLIDSRVLSQLDYFLRGLDHSYKDSYNREIQEESIQLYVEALKTTNPLFSFNNWEKFKYSYLELRILFAIASLHGYLRNCELSNDMLFFILKSMDESAFTKHYDKLLFIKVLTVISYNYHRIDLHDKALEFAQKGIDYCNKFFLMANLPILLARKGAAMYYLNMENYETYLDQSIQLLYIQNNPKMAEDHIRIFERYRRTPLFTNN